MADGSPLCRQIIEDMTVRNLSPATQRPYIHTIAKFSRFLAARPTGLASTRCARFNCIWPTAAFPGRG